MDISQQLGICC